MKRAIFIGAWLATAAVGLYGFATDSAALMLYASIVGGALLIAHEWSVNRKVRSASDDLRWSGSVYEVFDPELAEATFDWRHEDAAA